MLGSTSMMMRCHDLMLEDIEKKECRERSGSCSDATRLEVAYNIARYTNTVQALSEMDTTSEKKNQKFISCTCAIM
ncbi:unnamed protein product [Blepharisma stoltei]|uniref:Uncharacterized protein n=1 Tax=Blepharisma stoltei TaxID=1481888 RepID=A0AAU9K0F5_9CILI|nr:unnamed protein product [Blepharisma stoltei]